MKDVIEETKRLILNNNRKNLTEMARIGYLYDKKGRPEEQFEVYINTNDDGDRPHFHLRYEPDWDEFHSCIRIDCCEYFEHEGKESTLNSSMRKRLVNFLTSINEDDDSKTNWQVLVIEWNRNNSNQKVDKDIEMPDYLNLK